MGHFSRFDPWRGPVRQAKYRPPGRVPGPEKIGPA